VTTAVTVVEALRASLSGRFELGELAGRGGMGVVYAGRGPGGEKVAIKLITVRTADDAARFSREAEVLERLDHPRIVRYVSHGVTAEGEPYIVMRWIDGESLAKRLERGALAPAEAMVMGAALADGLAAAHAHGVIHRDLKPSNIMLAGGDPAAPVLIDFGIARDLSSDAAVTRTGDLVGTPGFLAPELTRGGGAIDHRSDLFGLGCVLFEAIAGRGTFTGDNTLTTLARVLVEVPPPLTEVAPETPPALAALVAELLAKEPAERPGSAAEVATRIRGIVRDPGAPVRSRRPRRWRRPLAIAAVIAAAGGTAAALIATRHPQPPPPPAGRADVEVIVPAAGAVVPPPPPREQPAARLGDHRWRTPAMTSRLAVCGGTTWALDAAGGLTRFAGDGEPTAVAALGGTGRMLGVLACDDRVVVAAMRDGEALRVEGAHVERVANLDAIVDAVVVDGVAYLLTGGGAVLAWRPGETPSAAWSAAVIAPDDMMAEGQITGGSGDGRSARPGDLTSNDSRFALAPDARSFVRGETAGVVVYDATGARARLETPARAVAWLDDAVAVIDKAGALWRWRPGTRTAEPLAAPGMPALLKIVATTPQWIVARTKVRSLYLWPRDPHAGPPHALAVDGFAAAADGTQLYAGLVRGRILRGELAATAWSEPAFSFEAPQAIAWSPDDAQLAVTANAPTLWIAPVDGGPARSVAADLDAWGLRWTAADTIELVGDHRRAVVIDGAATVTADPPREAPRLLGGFELRSGSALIVADGDAVPREISWFPPPIVPWRGFVDQGPARAIIAGRRADHGEVEIYDLATGARVRAADLETSVAGVVGALAGTDRLALVGAGDALYELEPARARAVVRAGREIIGLDAAPDGAWVAVSFDDGTIAIWDRRDGRWIAALATHPHGALAWSHDGARLAVAERDGSVTIWSAP